ncbi:hypothetical protein ACFL96_17300, partial [Thermoproteota archaeon]
AVRSQIEIKRWFDRELSEYIKDYIVAWRILRGDRQKGKKSKLKKGKSNKAHEYNDHLTKQMVEKIRKIKDKYEGLSKEEQELKDIYDNRKESKKGLYWWVDKEIAAISGEVRGRVVTKTAIAVDQLKLNAEIKKEGRKTKRERTLDGNVMYLFKRTTDKEYGPLREEQGKDQFVLTFFPEFEKLKKVIPNDEIPLLLDYLQTADHSSLPKDSKLSQMSPEKIAKALGTAVEVYNRLDEIEKPAHDNIRDVKIINWHKKIPRLPEFFGFENPIVHKVVRDKIWVYKSYFIDCFEHETFDGILPEGCPLVEKLPEYRPIINDLAEYLRELQRENSDTSTGKLDFTAEERADHYKNSRSLITAALARGLTEEISNVLKEYEEITKGVLHTTTENLQDRVMKKIINAGFGYMIDASKDFRLMQLYSLNKDKMSIAALLCSLGGAKMRLLSPDIPKYATRLLPLKLNEKRVENETKEAATTIESYPALVELGIPELMRAKAEPTSEVYKKGHMLAVERMIVTLADRYVHYSSERSFRPAMEDSRDVVYKIREEMSDIIKEDKTGHTEKIYAIVEHAFLRTIGLDKYNDVPFISKDEKNQVYKTKKVKKRKKAA